jgi:hypothetical protein
MPSTGKSEPRGSRFPGEALQKYASCRQMRLLWGKIKKRKVLKERLIGVCAFDAIPALETATGSQVLEARKWWK